MPFALSTQPGLNNFAESDFCNSRRLAMRASARLSSTISVGPCPRIQITTISAKMRKKKSAQTSVKKPLGFEWEESTVDMSVRKFDGRGQTWVAGREEVTFTDFLEEEPAKDSANPNHGGEIEDTRGNALLVESWQNDNIDID